jgi:Antitoxin Phd_YefM, type II toxin-antitoxin system
MAFPGLFGFFSPVAGRRSRSRRVLCLHPIMTIMTIIVVCPRRRDMSTQMWTVAEAKAKFSELIDKAKSEGPQRITKHGRTNRPQGQLS